MSSQNAAQFMAINRMNRETFVKLQPLLISERGDLTSQRTIGTAEKQMIFITSFNRRLNEICERFQHSSSTISEIVHQLRDC